VRTVSLAMADHHLPTITEHVASYGALAEAAAQVVQAGTRLLPGELRQ